MANLANDIETGNGWTLVAPAVLSSDKAYAGSEAAKVQYIYSTLGGEQFGEVYKRPLATATVDEQYQFSAWIDGDDRNNQNAPQVDLRVFVDKGGGTGWEQVDTLEWDNWAGSGWTFTEFPAFKAEGTSVGIRFRADGTTTGGGETLKGWWWVDNPRCSVGVELAERAIDALASNMQTNFGTILGEIDTDRADGITLAVPAAGQYYKRPKAEIAGADAHVEIFEESGFEIANPYQNVGPDRAAFEVPLIVRVTYFKRAGEDGDEMWQRGRRYLAALKILTLEQYNFGGTDDALKEMHMVEAIPDPQFFQGATPNKMQVAARILVTCEEVNA